MSTILLDPEWNPREQERQRLISTAQILKNMRLFVESRAGFPLVILHSISGSLRRLTRNRGPPASHTPWSAEVGIRGNGFTHLPCGNCPAGTRREMWLEQGPCGTRQIAQRGGPGAAEPWRRGTSRGPAGTSALLLLHCPPRTSVFQSAVTGAILQHEVIGPRSHHRTLRDQERHG